MRLLRECDQQPLELLVIGVGGHRGFAFLERLNLLVERKALGVQRGETRVAARPRMSGSAAREKESPRELAFVRNLWMLGGQLAIRLVESLHLGLGVAKGLEQGDAAVLVGVRAIARERVD